MVIQTAYMRMGSGRVQGTGLAQWETMGPGLCPCLGPALTCPHGTIFLFGPCTSQDPVQFE